MCVGRRVQCTSETISKLVALPRYRGGEGGGGREQSPVSMATATAPLEAPAIPLRYNAEAGLVIMSNLERLNPKIITRPTTPS